MRKLINNLSNKSLTKFEEDFKNNRRHVSIITVGDICLGMGIREKIEKYGPSFIFEKVTSVLKEGDIVFGNLECVIGKSNHIGLSASHDMLVPSQHARGIKEAGFNILNIANNHIMDYGSDALKETIDFLEKNEISHVGAGISEKMARHPAVFKKNGITIGFLGYSDNSTGNILSIDPVARKNKAGIAEYNEEKILKDIIDLRDKVDIKVVSLHADLEFVEYPAPSRVRFCRKLIDSGADIILQHHPHVPQGMEKYKEGLIVYSLGNFVFPVTGNEYQESGSSYCNKSFILKIYVDKAQILGMKIIPVCINSDHQPEINHGRDGEKFMRYLTQISKPLENEKVLAELWFKTCLKYFKKNISWLKIIFLCSGFSGFFKRVFYLFKTIENKRWINGLINGLFRKFLPIFKLI